MVNRNPMVMVNRNTMPMVSRNPMVMVNRIPILRELLYGLRKLYRSENDKRENVRKGSNL